MGYDKQRRCCKCESWGKEGEQGWWRVCSTLYISCGRIYRGKVDAGESLTTPEGFSCGEFTEKPKGPFRVEKPNPEGKWYVNAYFPNHRAWIHNGSEYDCNRIATFLNARWERRE